MQPIELLRDGRRAMALVLSLISSSPTANRLARGLRALAPLPRRLAIFSGAVALLLSLMHSAPAIAQTQTYPCETVIQIGSGTSTNGTKLRPGSVDPFFKTGS